MKYLKIIIDSCLLLALYQSCKEPIDIEVEDAERKIVLNSWFGLDSLITVHMGLSAGILDAKKELKFIDDAQVKLYKNNQLLETLQSDTNGYYFSEHLAATGNEYKVEIEYKNLEKITAKTTLPKPVKISSFEADYLITSYEDNPNGDTIYNLSKADISLTFKDHVNEQNFYFLSFTRKKPIYQYTPYGTEYLDTKVTGIEYDVRLFNYQNFFDSGKQKGYVFSDEFFDGKAYNLKAELYDYEPVIDEFLYINLYTINKDFYEYVISYSKYLDAQDNPLAEPVNVFSNIEGGMGFFSSYTAQQDTLVMELPFKTPPNK